MKIELKKSPIVVLAKLAMRKGTKELTKTIESLPIFEIRFDAVERIFVPKLSVTKVIEVLQ